MYPEELALKKSLTVCTMYLTTRYVVYVHSYTYIIVTCTTKQNYLVIKVGLGCVCLKDNRTTRYFGLSMINSNLLIDKHYHENELLSGYA